MAQARPNLTTRRSLLAGAVASSAAVSLVPIPAAAHSDGRLLAIAARLAQLGAELERIDEIWTGLEKSYRERLPQLPDEFCPSGGDPALGIRWPFRPLTHYTEEMVEPVRRAFTGGEFGPDLAPRAAELSYALDRWQARCSESWDELGLDRLKLKRDAAENEFDDLKRELLLLPASTPAGLRAKAGFLRDLLGGDLDPFDNETTDVKVALSIARDVLRMEAA